MAPVFAGIEVVAFRQAGLGDLAWGQDSAAAKRAARVNPAGRSGGRCGSHPLSFGIPKNISPNGCEHVGFVFQAYNLLGWLTVEQNITLPLRLSGRPVDRDVLREVARAVELDVRMDKRPSELSGGQQQRVALARPGGPSRWRPGGAGARSGRWEARVTVGDACCGDRVDRDEGHPSPMPASTRG